MKTKYIKVSVADRLPKERGYYFTNYGIVEYFTECQEFLLNGITFWLDEVPDTEEEMKDIVHTEGVLIGLNICKQLWAQGTISHENIQEEIYHYKEELNCLLQPLK